MEKLQKISAIVFTVIFCMFVYAIKSTSDKPQSLKTAQTTEFENQFSGKAIVIDGDSIKIDDGASIREVRLVGIDAPEYKQTCFNAQNQEYHCGQDARQFLVNLINDQQVTCYYNQKDVYNRFLGKCVIDTISINQALLKSGMALIYDYNQSNDLMKDLEQSARNQKLGIWQGHFQTPKDYRKSHRRH